jgi:hypothetical protein
VVIKYWLEQFISCEEKQMQIVNWNGVLLGAVERVDREVLMPWVADFRPAEARVRVLCGHNVLCPINDGPGRRFRQMGTGVLTVSGQLVAVIFFRNKEKKEIIAVIPKKFISLLPSRKATA